MPAKSADSGARGEVVLDLAALSRGIPALTSALGTVLAEAAAICLTSQGHKSRVVLKVRKTKTPTYRLRWSTVTAKMTSVYADKDEATEWGAAGIAILLVREAVGLTAIERSAKGTGIDYWLGPQPKPGELPFQRKARLEVSGLRKGTESEFKTRVSRKIVQAKRSASTRLKAYIVIVEFGAPQAQIEEQ